MPRYILVRETASTNTYIARMAAMLPSGTVIHTPCQTAGRGQRGNSWESEPGKNIAFSMLLKNPAVAPTRQFYISEAASLAVADCLNSIHPGFSLKWPNDIYFADSKVAGMLIEHTLTSKAISQTIIGIGINLNHPNFRSDAPTPISLKQITGNSHDTDALLHDVCNRLEAMGRFDGYTEADYKALHQRYLSNLSRGDGLMHTFALPDGSRFEAAIANVKPTGTLCLLTDDEQMLEFAFKEVAFII